MLRRGYLFHRFYLRGGVTVTATVGAKEHPIYDGVGPWLEAASVTPAQPPKEELVYFLR